MKGLTAKQHEILTYIQSFLNAHGYAPSYREIKDHFKLSSLGSVYKHIKCLEKRGAIELQKGSHRSMKPLIPDHSLEIKKLESQVPLIGNLSIGYPLELFIQPKMIAVPSSMICLIDNSYLVQIQGDALKEDAMLDGDLLLIEARQEIQPGEIILGLINQTDSVVKRYYPEGQYIRLESPYQSSSLIVRSEHIAIQGAVVSLLRDLS